MKELLGKLDTISDALSKCVFPATVYLEPVPDIERFEHRLTPEYALQRDKDELKEEKCMPDGLLTLACKTLDNLSVISQSFDAELRLLVECLQTNSAHPISTDLFGKIRSFRKAFSSFKQAVTEFQTAFSLSTVQRYLMSCSLVDLSSFPVPVALYSSKITSLYTYAMSEALRKFQADLTVITLLPNLLFNPLFYEIDPRFVSLLQIAACSVEEMQAARDLAQQIANDHRTFDDPALGSINASAADLVSRLNTKVVSADFSLAPLEIDAQHFALDLEALRHSSLGIENVQVFIENRAGSWVCSPATATLDVGSAVRKWSDVSESHFTLFNKAAEQIRWSISDDAGLRSALQVLPQQGQLLPNRSQQVRIAINTRKAPASYHSTCSLSVNGGAPAFSCKVTCQIVSFALDISLPSLADAASSSSSSSSFSSSSSSSSSSYDLDFDLIGLGASAPVREFTILNRNPVSLRMKARCLPSRNSDGAFMFSSRHEGIVFKELILGPNSSENLAVLWKLPTSSGLCSSIIELFFSPTMVYTIHCHGTACRPRISARIENLILSPGNMIPGYSLSAFCPNSSSSCNITIKNEGDCPVHVCSHVLSVLASMFHHYLFCSLYSSFQISATVKDAPSPPPTASLDVSPSVQTIRDHSTAVLSVTASSSCTLLRWNRELAIHCEETRSTYQISLSGSCEWPAIGHF